MVMTMARRILVLLTPLSAGAAAFLKINSVLLASPQHHLVMQRVANRRRSRHRALGA